MIFRPELAQAILGGRKTVTRRPRHGSNPSGEIGGWVDDPCRYRAGGGPGGTYALQPGRGKPAVARLRVLSVRPERMCDLTDEEIRREGFETRQQFEQAWVAIYGRGSYLDIVWRIEFELATEERAAA